ncbi:MAG: nodulation protein NfeD [Hyphomicrobiaceae bacterium]|nr:nodulation protein NfeD [Hyphomicrobiaceae bacterium]
MIHDKTQCGAPFLARLQRLGQGVIRSVWLICCVFIGLAGLSAAHHAGAQEPTAERSRRVAVLVDVDGAIGPANVRHVEIAIAEAHERHAELVILLLDTPGGLVTSMREMVAAIIASRIPVVGYVAPSGARAASAGTFIIYATHVAAMAPGTNIGAATPITMGMPGLPETDPNKKKEAEKADEEKSSDDKTEPASPKDPAKAKAVNDAVAFIRSLAELRDRNVGWAEEAVRKASSISANEALRLGVINLVARDVDALLSDLDGRKVVIGGKDETLSTKGLTVERVEPDALTELLKIITDPNIALILLMIGVYGLIFEFATPGSIGPGVVGAICLVLGLYALNQLPFNYTGLALVLIGVVCMVAEAFTPTFGVLGIGGLIAFVLGAVFLIDTDVPAFQLSWTVIAGTALASGLILIVLLGYALRAMHRSISGGVGGVVGNVAKVLDWSGSTGHVWVHGERWEARSSERLEGDQHVRVLRVDGLTLVVSPVLSEVSPQQSQEQGV